LNVLTVNAGSTSLKLATIRDAAVQNAWGSLEEAFAAGPPDCVAHRVVHGGRRRAAVVVDDAVIDELASLTELAPLHQLPTLAAIEVSRTRCPAVPNVACFDTAFHATIPVAARTYALPARYRDVVQVYVVPRPVVRMGERTDADACTRRPTGAPRAPGWWSVAVRDH